jgi:tRNA dimethylallyltransferase
MDQSPFLMAVMGPTASGKSDLAESLAAHFDAQLINADAFQVYRKLDIGTAKPADRTPYELLDILDPRDNFGVGAWIGRVMPILESLFAQGRSAIVVGGTGFYIRALFEEYDAMDGSPDPELRAQLELELARDGLPAMLERVRALDPAAANRVDPQNPVRVRRALEKALSPNPKMTVRLPNFRKIKVGIDVSKEVLENRIVSRTKNMVQMGWLEEIERLADEEYSLSDPGLRAIGYDHMWRHRFGKVGLDEAIANTIVDTTRYAKRQRTWLKSEPRLQMHIGGSELFARLRNDLELMFTEDR